MGSCLGLCCCSILCCQCNFAIFPSPSPSYEKNSNDKQIKYFTNQSGHEVPYLQLLVNHPKLNIIFFHGNAEDLLYCTPFLLPIQEELNANVYSMEYPTYGTYQLSIPGRISDLIKSNSLQFYDFLVRTKSPVINSKNTLIIGRSIGSGGASYLASHKKIDNLALISPFSSIPSVAGDFVGCVGKVLVKNHFNNIQQIQHFNGRLLIIHGRMDEVINFRHGELCADTYNKNNKTFHVERNVMGEGETVTQIGNFKFIAPKFMTHNNFRFEEDIIEPLAQFAHPIQINK